MPRNRVRKTSIGLHTEEQMSNALKLISDGQKIRAVARSTGIPFTTLYRYHIKVKNNPDPEKPIRLTPNYAVHKIFTDEQEKNIVDYIAKCSQMFYGLTITDVRSLIYEVAMLNNIKVPDKWHETKLAGIEYLYNLRKRDNRLSLRTPEGCSLSRATSFNRHNVGVFFDNLENVMARHVVFGNGTRVFNLDETNTMTVQKCAKVLAAKGQRQVSKVTSAERGTLTTTCYIVSALGNALPPVIIFPRVHFKQHMIAEAPAGTLGLATPSGWMNSDLFVKTMQHFIVHSNSSIDNPSLLIYDNHESHICIEALNLAKENGVTILTVPPHSTGKLQPLDVGIFGPFKTAYNKAVDSWMLRNPGKTFSIYEVAGCVREAHMKAMTPGNICAAFKATGIFPFDRNVFTDLDFTPSEVTDRQVNVENDQNEINRPVQDNESRTPSPSILELSCPGSNQDVQIEESCAQSTHNDRTKTPLPCELQPNITPTNTNTNKLSETMVSASCSNKSSNVDLTAAVAATSSTNVEKGFLSPFQFRGLPKAGPRKGGRAPRRKGKSMIATDTPNKNEIQTREEEKKRKQIKAIAKTKKRKILQESSSEDEDHMSVYSEEESIFEDEGNLFWPETDETRQNKKRKLKEKIPFTVTSPAWKAYNAKKEEQKRKQIEEKELRAKNREEKRLEKLKKKKGSKQRNRSDSSETETEIIYAESDESVMSKGSESDHTPLSMLVPPQQKLSKGSYVIVLYEEQHFPGIIENVSKYEFEVSTMTFSTGNTYKWPEKPDKMWYQRKDIVECICPPILINKRGFYNVKEMQKYSIFTS